MTSFACPCSTKFTRLIAHDENTVSPIVSSTFSNKRFLVGNANTTTPFRDGFGFGFLARFYRIA